MSKAGLQLSIRAMAGRRYVPFLRRHLPGVSARVLRSGLREISLVLAGERLMGRLHQRYLGKSGPTDVLAFALESDRRGRTISGEIIICVPVALRCARLRSRDAGFGGLRGTRSSADTNGGPVKRQAVARELLLYALHGLLHLCGMEDTTARGFAHMHRTENRILTRLGVGPVFGRVEPSSHK